MVDFERVDGVFSMINFVQEMNITYFVHKIEMINFMHDMNMTDLFMK